MQAVIADTMQGVEEVRLKIDGLLKRDVDKRALVSRGPVLVRSQSRRLEQ
jgi:hypothetical protein